MNFDFLFTAFGTVLAMLYELRHSYAFMIIGLTLIVMVVVTPLTLKATRSMLMMQQLQPELKKLQSKYKDDRQQLNEEMLKFYRENNINPVGGCLPLLVQTPVFLVLYSVLRGLTMRVPVMGSNVGWVTGQHLTDLSVTTPPAVIHPFEPMYVPHDSLLYQNLSQATEMRSLGLDLSRSASDIFSTSGVVAALPYMLLIVLVAITSIVQQRQIQARNTGTAINPQQQAIMKIMPIFLPVFSIVVPAGLVLYFVVSNTYRVGQQWFISRNIYGKAEQAKADKGEGEVKPYEPSGSGGAGGLRGWWDQLSGRAETASDEGEEPKQASRPAPKKKAAAKSGGGRTTPSSKPTAKPAAKPAAKAKATGGSGTERNGRDRSTAAAGKQKAGSRTSSASGSGSRTTSPKQGSGSSGSGSSTDRPATLQPRARKNKKR